MDVLTRGSSSSMEPSRSIRDAAAVDQPRSAAAARAKLEQDRVVLSAAARAASAEGPTSAAVPAAGAPAQALTSRSEQRAAGLIAALDADQDGAVSKEEFVDGALSLMGRARPHRHGHGSRRTDEGSGDGLGDDTRVDGHRHHRGFRRFERRLDRAFDRIDADGSGTVDKGELTAVLDRVAARRAVNPQPPSPPSVGADPAAAHATALTSPQTPPSTTPEAQPAPATVATPVGAAFSFTVTMTTTVTYSVAVQRYQAAAQMEP